MFWKSIVLQCNYTILTSIWSATRGYKIVLCWTKMSFLISPYVRGRSWPCTPPQRNLKTEISLWKRIKCFSSSLRRRNLKKAQQSPAILDLCFKKTRAGKWQGYRYIWLRFRKDQFLKYFPSKLRRNEGVLKFVRFEERFEKAVPYSWLINCGQ